MVLEYLGHLKKWWYLYLSLWFLAAALAGYVGTVKYYSQSDTYEYTATGVYRASTSGAAKEWSYLASLHAGISSKVPLEGNKFFEITQVGANAEELPVNIALVLTASRSGFRDAVEIRAPVVTVQAAPRSLYHWLATTAAVAVLVMGAIHAVPYIRLASREEYEPQVVYTCPLLVSYRESGEFPRAEVAELVDAPDLKSGTH